MCNRKFLLFFFFILTSLKCFPAVFVVTSNADSGPGTLRDALTQAAANGQANNINFNLPGNTVADRTITLSSSLPIITSSIVIDGTSQPGKPFGVSDTKIHIISNFSYAPGGLRGVFEALNCSDVEIYGMWISNAVNLGYQASFFISNCGTDKIGAALKGNLIDDEGPTIDTVKTCFFQHNICFSDTTGEKPGAGAISFSDCEDLTIGGSAQTGNMIAASLEISFATPAANKLDLSYNKLGTDFTGTQAPYGFNLMGSTPRVEVLGSYAVPVGIIANIKNNIIADVYDNTLLEVANFSLGGKVTIQGNAFNTDFTGTLNFNAFSQGGTEYAIDVAGDADVLIGGDDPSQKNLIAYSGDGIGYFSNGKCTITKNSIFCVGEVSFIGYVGADQLPQVTINQVTASQISGTATPSSKIELFNADCSCTTTPNPKDYFATVNSDANGNWSYTGTPGGYIMASATTDSLTGYFKGATIDESSLKIKNYSCNTTGSITGLVNPYTTAKVYWYDSNGKLVGNTINLTNVPAGTYTLKVDYGGNCDISKTYTIQDYSITIDSSQVNITQPSCNKPTGSVTGINAYSNDPDALLYSWTDGSGKVWSTSPNLQNAPAGIYTLLISRTTDNCTVTYGPVTLKNTTGPNIDQSNQKIQSTNCGQSTGSITNITATGTGTLKFIWWNDQQQKVGTSLDLLNQPAGTYKLEITDDTQCGPIYSTYIVIPEINGITMDETKAQTSPASCSKNNGSVTGIQVSGASLYQWRDANNVLVASTTDLLNVEAGTYTLTASTASGCSKSSKPYTIINPPPTTYSQGINDEVLFTCANTSNGSITITRLDTAMKAERWVNSQGQTIGSGLSVSNLAPGTYQLYVTDRYGCESFYQNFDVSQIPEFAVTDQGQVTDETCGLKNGGISAVTVTGGTPPYTYNWTDANGNAVGSASSIANLAAGNYMLSIADQGNCGGKTINYTINAQSQNIAAPSVTDLQLCSSGSALLTVNNASSSAVYNLYDNATSTTPIDEQKGGRFTINASGNRSYYVSEVSGTCESSRAQVNVTVGLSNLSIANTFTPNGDGINDYWNINGIASYPNAMVQIFTRYGQKIFESKGYPAPFDGTYKGQKLSAGVYYYIINLNTKCSLLSGSLTIIR